MVTGTPIAPRLIYLIVILIFLGREPHFNSKKKSPPHSSCGDEILPYSAAAADFSYTTMFDCPSLQEIVRRDNNERGPSINGVSWHPPSPFLSPVAKSMSWPGVFWAIGLSCEYQIHATSPFFWSYLGYPISADVIYGWSHWRDANATMAMMMEADFNWGSNLRDLLYDCKPTHLEGDDNLFGWNWVPLLVLTDNSIEIS